MNTVDYHGVPGRYYHVARERTLDMALSHTLFVFSVELEVK